MREALLKALDEATPPFRKQVRDSLPAENIAELAGVGAHVGSPDTRMAIAMRELHELEKKGIIERAKAEEDTENGGPKKYRISQLGEREIAQSKIRGLTFELEKALEALPLEAARIRGQLMAEHARAISELVDELRWAKRPLWRKALRRPPVSLPEAE